MLAFPLVKTEVDGAAADDLSPGCPAVFAAHVIVSVGWLASTPGWSRSASLGLAAGDPDLVCVCYAAMGLLSGVFLSRSQRAPWPPVSSSR